MLISLSSGNYDIVASGQAFLFSKDDDFRIDIQADKGFTFSLTLNFVEDESAKRDMQVKTHENEIVLTCLNFENTGAGLKEPVKLAEIDGRGLYFVFWSYLEGKASRSVKYTIFAEKSEKE